MLALHVRGQRTELPTGWADCGPALAWQLLRTLVRHPPGRAKLEALRTLTGLRKRDFYRLDAVDIATLDAATPWLAPAPINEAFRPSFWSCLHRYHLPAARFENGACITLAYADEFYLATLEADDDLEADRQARLLLATLATRHRSGGRTELTERRDIEARANRFRRLPPEYALQVIMYWSGIRKFIDEAYGDMLFRGSPLDKPPAGEIRSFGWWSIFQEVAESGVFGSLNDVYLAPFHDVAIYLVRKESIRRAQQLEMENMKLQRR